MGDTRCPPPSMDSIKKKMQSLARETANATARAEKWEKEVAAINATADGFEEQVKNLQKKIQQTESAFDVCTEDLFNQTIKLEEMEKKAGNAEGQVGDLARRLLLMEESSVKSEERLAISATNLAKTSIDADQSIKDQHVISEVCAKKSENEDELKVVGANQQTLEVSEEKSLEREDVLQKQIKELMAKLKLADTRSENAEMDIGRLNVRIDKVEEDL